MLTIDLTGKVALVTGGSRGIGAAITEMFCRAGATVVFTHTGKAEYSSHISELLDRIRQDNGHATDAALDATDPHATKSLVANMAEDYGRVDVLVCNVGQNIARPAESITDEAWTKAIDTNLNSAFYPVREVLPHMLKQGYGRIIFIGSSAACDGGGGAMDYAAAKSGLIGMMLYLQKNYVRKGIIANTVHPCVIETDLLRERYPSEEDKQKLISQIPVGRLGKPEDIAGMVAYLASPWGDYICGQSILLDGGRTLGR